MQPYAALCPLRVCYAMLAGPFYNILKTQKDWMAAQGVPAADASYFIGRTYLGLAQVGR
jgi:hypothetical protein